MITKTKRLIYIVIIVACVLGSIAIFLFLKPQTPGLDGMPQPASGGPGRGAQAEDPSAPPRVFPYDTGFDLTVFSSSKFKNLKPSTPISVEESELGKDDPFKR